MNKKNGLLKFLVCGSVDDGKSTLIGHILYDSKLLYADQEQALILDSRVGSRGGEIDYSLLLDGLVAEREQGITIDVAYRYFSTERRSFIVADAPGHEEYTRNMAVGASFAELAVILVDSSQGVLIQTRRHARICALMGIRHFAFAINKMDLVGYSQTRYNEIMGDIVNLCAEACVEKSIVIPVSATGGDNITKRSEAMPWYKGVTILEYLETVDISGSKPETGFYLPVQRVSRPDGNFRGYQGQVESGAVVVNDVLTVLPGGQTASVKSIFVADKKSDSAISGQPVTIQLDHEVDISRGCVLTRDADLKIGNSFYATLLCLDEQKLIPGREYWMKLGTRLTPAVVSSIGHQVEVNTGTFLPAVEVGKNEIARCEIVLSETTVLDEFRLHKAMGGLILIDRLSHATAACGVIDDVGDKSTQGVILQEKERKFSVRLFDAFYYHPNIHTVLRHIPAPVVYSPGDELPLRSAAFNYPLDFDIHTESGCAHIRGGVFTGFGGRDSKYPLLDAAGIELGSNQSRDFGKYRQVAHWEKDYEI
jgi:sulfate adenylyltransferase subunit 1